MDDDRQLGVTETRLGLTVLICLLVVLGYAILYKLGGTGQTTMVEVRPDVVQTDSPANDAPPTDDPLPNVLQVEASDSTAPEIQTSQRLKTSPRIEDRFKH